MIPRIAKLDKEFASAVRVYIQARSRRRGILSQIASHVIHEGTSNSISRSPLENDPTKMFEAGAETKIEFTEIESVDASYILNKADELADQFERQFSAHLFETMDDATKKSGLRYDGGGRPLTNEAFIEALSQMHMDFDKLGKLLDTSIQKSWDNVIADAKQSNTPSIPTQLFGRPQLVLLYCLFVPQRMDRDIILWLDREFCRTWY